MKTFLLLALALPGVLFLVSGLLWFLGVRPSERLVARASQAVYVFSAITFTIEAIRIFTPGDLGLEMQLGDWFATAHSHFGVPVLIDRLSVPILWLTALLMVLVSAFSMRYLHRDVGYVRFFNLLNLFSFGAFLVAAAGSIDVLMGGWELVGITSVLLIGFFQQRPEPVGNALKVYGYYRIADVFLIGAVLLGHVWFGGVEFAHLPAAEGGASTRVTVVALLMIFAACGKSSVGPFLGWLPRAMEGPTPSSAIFYGSISVHLGAFLLLRAEPVILASPVAQAVLVVVGLGSAVIGTLTHRSSTDAKTLLAHATQTQLGLIFVEIGLGWTGIAMWHMGGHAVIRTAQFLRAPSMLHEHHHVYRASGGDMKPTGSHLEAMIPRNIQVWLYRLAIGSGFYEAALERLLIQPVCRVAGWLSVLEPAPGPRKASTDSKH